jgi:hypothetical protein
MHCLSSTCFGLEPSTLGLGASFPQQPFLLRSQCIAAPVRSFAPLPVIHRSLLPRPRVGFLYSVNPSFWIGLLYQSIHGLIMFSFHFPVLPGWPIKVYLRKNFGVATMTSPPRVSMEITNDMLKGMEVRLAFRDYVSSHTRTSLL